MIIPNILGSTTPAKNHQPTGVSNAATAQMGIYHGQALQYEHPRNDMRKNEHHEFYMLLPRQHLLQCSWEILGFPKMGLAQNGWFFSGKSENQMDDLIIPPWLRTPPISAMQHRGSQKWPLLSSVDQLELDRLGIVGDHDSPERNILGFISNKIRWEYKANHFQRGYHDNVMIIYIHIIYIYIHNIYT